MVETKVDIVNTLAVCSKHHCPSIQPHKTARLAEDFKNKCMCNGVRREPLGHKHKNYYFTCIIYCVTFDFFSTLILE